MTLPGEACRQAPPQELLRGVMEFNRGDYFECHETLEEIWIAEKGPVRRLYQGILQIGIALLHRQKGNYKGAMSLLQSGADYLRPFSPLCRSVDVAALIAEAERLRQALEASGPEGMADLDPGLIPRIRLVASDRPSSS